MSSLVIDLSDVQVKFYDPSDLEIYFGFTFSQWTFILFGIIIKEAIVINLFPALNELISFIERIEIRNGLFVVINA